MRDQRDPWVLGAQILAIKQARNCSILEAADRAENQFSIESAPLGSFVPWEKFPAEASGLLSSPGTNGPGPTRRIFDEDGA